MGTLADIGASGAGTSIADYVSRETQLRKRRELIDAQKSFMGARAEALGVSSEIDRNKLLLQRQQMAENNRVIQWDTVLNRFKVPAAADYATKLANELGYINPDGTIRVGQAKELQQYLSLPMHMQNVSTMRVEHYKNQYETLVRASKDPEFAKKRGIKMKPEEFQQAIKATELQLNAATGQNAGLMNWIEEQNKLYTARLNAEMGRSRLAETKRHNQAMEALKKAANESNYTLSDEKLKIWQRFISDPDSINDQEKEMIGVLVDPFLRVSTNIVLSDLGNIALPYTQKLEKILTISDTFKTYSQTGKMPKSGVSQEIYDFYKREHGMTKQQVDEALKKKHGK